MRKLREIQQSLYGWHVPYTIENDNHDIETRMLLDFVNTTNPAISYLVWPSFGDIHTFKKVERFVFNRKFNYCEYEQADGTIISGGYIKFEVYAQCGNQLFCVEYLNTRNRAKRLTHKLNRKLREGCRIFRFAHDGKFTAI